jgi:hypothetical protein
MEKEKNKKITVYFKLWCGHIQLHKMEGVTPGQTRIYCRQCSDLITVVKKSPSRWD